MIKIINFIEKITGAAGLLAAGLVLPLILITCYEVFARYVFNVPTIWAYELGYMLTGAYFLLGCAYTLREQGHIRIDIFYNRFPVKLQAVIKVLGYLCLFLPLAWWLSSALLQYAIEAHESGETSGQSAWNPVIWPFRLVIWAGFSLLALQATAEFIKFIYILIGKPLSGSSHETEQAEV